MICKKLSGATSRSLHPVRGIVSTVVHQLGVKIHSKVEGEKHLLAAAFESDKPLVNFAPYGEINLIFYHTLKTQRENNYELCKCKGIRQSSWAVETNFFQISFLAISIWYEI